MALFSISEELL